MSNSQPECSEPEGEDPLPRDRLFALLSDDRRRYVVRYLQEATAPVALADLARTITERESAGPPAGAENRERTIHRSLYHWHVPKLADAGVVDHDRDRGTAEPGPSFERAAELCDAVQDIEAPEQGR